MAELTLKQRLAALEQQVATLLGRRTNGRPRKDWRRTVGVFTENPGMLEIFTEAQKLREADRKRAARGYLS
jgi:hypothetical protein